MKPYYAGIQQSRETITRYSRVQFNIFKSRTKLAVICFAAGLVVIGLALLTSYKALAVILVFLGCIVFANQDAGADYTANLVIDMFQGKYPRLKYAFFSSGFMIDSARYTLESRLAETSHSIAFSYSAARAPILIILY